MQRRSIVAALIGAGVCLVFWWLRSEPVSRRGVAETAADVESRMVSGEPGQKGVFVASVPRLTKTNTASSVKLESNQRNPAYDVVKLMSATGTTAFRAFESEARDPTWAVEREREVARFAERDIEKVGLEVELVRTECRHSTCILVIKGQDEKVLDHANLLLQYAPLANVYSPVGTERIDGAHYFVAALAYEEAERNDEAWAENYERYRLIELARRRRKGVPEDFPPIPED